MKGKLKKAGVAALLWVDQHKLALAAMALTGLGLDPALAQAAAGGLDPQTAATAAINYGLPLGGTVMGGIFLKTAIQAHHEGRGLGGHVMNGLGSVGLGFGGPAIIRTLGGP